MYDPVSSRYLENAVMKAIKVIKTLMEWDERGRAVFSVQDLRAIFPERSNATFSEGLRRMVRLGVLERVARGVYVNPMGRSRHHMLEKIAVTLRRGFVSYVSLETALCNYSIISQQTIGNLTVMTTGRKGRFYTPYGAIAFTHTKRSVAEILDRTADVGHPLRMAHPRLAIGDLRRVGRNMDLVDTEELEVIEEEMGLAA